MRNKMVRLSDLEYSHLKKAQKLVIEHGTDSIECENCGWKPKFKDWHLGSIILAGTNLLCHWLQNPECLEYFKKKLDEDE